jgi:hypothetical protein
VETGLPGVTQERRAVLSRVGKQDFGKKREFLEEGGYDAGKKLGRHTVQYVGAGKGGGGGGMKILVLGKEWSGGIEDIGVGNGMGGDD